MQENCKRSYNTVEFSWMPRVSIHILHCTAFLQSKFTFSIKLNLHEKRVCYSHEKTIFNGRVTAIIMTK